MGQGTDCHSRINGHNKFGWLSLGFPKHLFSEHFDGSEFLKVDVGVITASQGESRCPLHVTHRHCSL